MNLKSVSLTGVILFTLIMGIAAAKADKKLVLDLEMDSDLLALSHNIDGFLFKPTMNFSAHLAGNLSDQFHEDALTNHLVATALIRIDGHVAGYATEQEVIAIDPETGGKLAESSWLITLTQPGLNGVIAVAQQENAGPVFGVVAEVMQNPEGPWEDKFQSFLSSSNAPRVQMATDDLSGYLGGRFEEYNMINAADLKNFGRFRAKIQFVIYPNE